MPVARTLAFSIAVYLTLAFDVSGTLGCTGAFLARSALPFIFKGTFCSKVYDYINCLKQTYLSGMPQEDIDTIYSSLKYVGLDCDVSSLLPCGGAAVAGSLKCNNDRVIACAKSKVDMSGIEFKCSICTAYLSCFKTMCVHEFPILLNAVKIHLNEAERSCDLSSVSRSESLSLVSGAETPVLYASVLVTMAASTTVAAMLLSLAL